MKNWTSSVIAFLPMLLIACFGGFCLLLCVFPAAKARAAPPNPADDLFSVQQSDALGIGDLQREIPPEAAEILGELQIEEGLDFNAALGKIWEAALGHLGGSVRTALASGARILTIALLLSVAGAISEGGDVPDFIPLIGTVAVSVIAVGDVSSFVGFGAETARRLSTFSRALLPVIAAAAAASGAVTSSAAKYAATVLFVDLLLSFAIRVLLPLVFAYIAATIAGAALRSDPLTSAAGSIKWLCTTALVTITLCFTGYLSVTGIISGTADAVVTRTVKTAISSALPVVGSIVADAASTVIAGAGILRGATGVFGMLVIICLVLAPFISLGTHYLVYKAVSGLVSGLPGNRVGGLVSALGSAFGIVLSLVGASAFMLFFSIIASIKSVL